MYLCSTNACTHARHVVGFTLVRNDICGAFLCANRSYRYHPRTFFWAGCGRKVLYSNVRISMTASRPHFAPSNEHRSALLLFSHQALACANQQKFAMTFFGLGGRKVLIQKGTRCARRSKNTIFDGFRQSSRAKCVFSGHFREISTNWFRH